MANDSSTQPLMDAVAMLLRPLARMLIARGITFDGFAEAAKRAFVHAAKRDFALTGKRQTGSRVSVLTGLTRKEVARLQSESDTGIAQDDRKLNRAARVVSGWVRQHGRRKGASMSLPLEGRASFAELVRRYSGDMPLQAVLEELERTGTVKREPSGEVKLVNRTYLATQDKADKLIMLGTDVADLIACIGHNLEAKSGHTFFQRKTAYNNIPPAALPEIRAALAVEGQRFLESFDWVLAQRDRDSSAVHDESSGRARAVVGVYYYQEDFDPAREANDQAHARLRGKTE